MIDVRIRTEHEAEPAHLMDWPADRLDEVMPLIASWGIRFDVADVETSGHDARDRLVGQFVATSTGAYFEVICVDGSDA